jgi:hypothetical protein
MQPTSFVGGSTANPLGRPMEPPLDSRLVHYFVSCRLNGHDRVLIWYTGRGEQMTDGLLTDEEGFLLVFDSERLAHEYAMASQLRVDDPQSVHYDLDELAGWLEHSQKVVDCVETLNLWNLFSDVAASVPFDSAFRNLDRARPAIYEKIFVGNNLPVMTPPGEHYEPTWSQDEMRHIAKVMASGLELVKSALADQRPD